MKTLLSKWNNFFNAMHLSEAGRTQLREMRGAYYYGAQDVIALLLDAELIDKSAAPQVRILLEEIDTFATALSTGKPL